MVHEIQESIAPNGTLIRTVDTVRQFGPMNRLEALTEFAGTPSARKTIFTYSSTGRLLEKRLEGQAEPIVRYIYQEDGKIGSLIWGKDQKQTFSYTEDGNIKSVCDAKIWVNRWYNDGGELIEEKVYDLKANTSLLYKLAYTYDLKGRITSIELPDKSKIIYEYGPFACKSIKRISKEGHELYIHHYTEYDPLGRVQSEQLIGWAGNRVHEWGPGGKKAALLTDYLTLRIPDKKRDNCGNILSIAYDCEGVIKEKTYGYDPLDRLIKEQNHTYTYDSIGYRLSKDDKPYATNERGELITSLEDSYSYDLLGFLTQKKTPQKTLQFHHNALGHLSSISEGESSLASYEYDGFGRRIIKVDPASPKDKTLFFYVGDQELGAIDSSGKIHSLRIPGIEGESLSLQSVAIEIKGEVYAPLHDFSGNVIALVDPQERKIVESYSYSAFGEEEIFDESNTPIKNSALGNPWRYAEKRVDEESGLLFFGKRYYDPSTGRWITPDPTGLVEGINLYAYARNNPLSYGDSFGLSSSHRDNLENCQPHEHDRYFFRNRTDNSTRGGLQYKEAGCGLYAYDDQFEERYANQIALRAYHYFPSAIYDLQRPELPNGLEIGFINGITNSVSDASEKAELLSLLAGGYNVHAVYNATHGFPADLYECKLGLNQVATSPVHLLHQMWDDYFERVPEENCYLMVCHSQGTIHVRNALLDYSKEKRDRIIVIAVAPAAYIGKELCKKAYHYVSPLDIVPKIDKEGRKRAGESIYELPRHPDVPWYDMDHSFHSLTYRGRIKDRIEEYINQRK